MNTFVPYPDFTKSVKCLDNKRLSKQNLETFQILNILFGFSEGWKSHPAVKSWRKFEQALIVYGITVNNECVARGFKDKYDSYYSKYVKIAGFASNTDLVIPNWIKNIEVTESHKSRLICKGELDVVCGAIKKHLKIKKMDDWLLERYGKTKNALKWADCIELKNFCKLNHIDITEKNWYLQFGWDNDPSKEYVWAV